MSIFKQIPSLTEMQTIPALPIGKDREMFNNPDRGLRLEVIFKLKNIFPYQVDADIEEMRELVQRNVDYYEFAHPTLAQVYIYLTEFRVRKELPETVFTRIRAIFQIMREHNLKILLRFAYQWEMEDAHEEATEEFMCIHMKQLFPLVKENLDVVHVFQAGFLGAWGEWHSHHIKVDRANLLSNIVDNCPEPLFIQVRLPRYKNLLEDGDPRKARISHHNDSLFGEYNAGNDGSNPGTEEDDLFVQDSPYMPVDGELFWGNYSVADKDGYFPDPHRVRAFIYDRHFTSLSIKHNYFEDGVGLPYAMAKWRIQYFTPEELAKDGMICDPDYFAQRRDVFEYIRDHLGYRLKAGKLSVNAENGAVNTALDIINYGFSAPHRLTEAGLVLLDMEGNVVSDTALEGIQDWQPRKVGERDPEPLVHRAAGVLKAPKGTYYLGFYARNCAGTPVRLANDVIYERGYNIFGTVTVD